MKFENDEMCKVVASDGQWTIGYIDGFPAQWAGNMKIIAPGDEYEVALTGDEFSDGNQIFRVDDSRGVCFLPKAGEEWVEGF